MLTILTIKELHFSQSNYDLLYSYTNIIRLMDLCTLLTWMSVVQGLFQDFVVVSSLQVSSFLLCTSAVPLSNTCVCTFAPFHPDRPRCLSALHFSFCAIYLCLFADFLPSLQGRHLAAPCIAVAFSAADSFIYLEQKL